ncbi:hypothetical protein VPHD528_0047 [Vibrio phage D528]|nr:hypothetical protein MYOV002v2_p0044 [Vibrio phage 144E46.1]
MEQIDIRKDLIPERAIINLHLETVVPNNTIVAIGEGVAKIVRESGNCDCIIIMSLFNVNRFTAQKDGVDVVCASDGVDGLYKINYYNADEIDHMMCNVVYGVRKDLIARMSDSINSEFEHKFPHIDVTVQIEPEL